MSRTASSDAASEGERVAFAYRSIASQADWPYADISADGRHIVQVVRDSDGVDHVALRSLGSTEMVIVPGTAGARDPQFTPDGSAILFNARTRPCRVPLQGGTPTSTGDSASAAGFAFLPDGRLVTVRNQVGLQVFTADGRFVRQLTAVDTVRGEFSHWYPQALPGGRAVIFNSYATPLERSRIEAVDVESGERTVLVEGAIFARYVETGHLPFARNNAIYAVPFDAAELRVLGREVPVVEDVAMNVTNGTAGYAVSRTGTLVYMRASQWRVESRVLWADRSGATTPAIAEEGGWAEPRLSPDGRWIAVTRTDPQSQLWLYDNARGVLSQLTRSEGVSFSSVWTPDSRALLLVREVPQYDIYRQPIDGSAPSLAVGSRDDKLPLALSPDGRQLAFTNVRDRDRLTLADLGSGEQRLADEQPTDQRTADISPDGRWLAYGEANRAGNFDVFVRALDGSGGRRQVSADGGDQPRFTKGGREIVYRKGEAFIAVPFDPTLGEAGTPVPLFRVADAGRLSYGRTVGYDVTPDGARFLFVAPIERPEATPNVVVLNWFGDLRRMVPR